jgi:endonuclease/exonuclease/phosphatase (EEP) superfamily protein YafD
MRFPLSLRNVCKRTTLPPVGALPRKTWKTRGQWLLLRAIWLHLALALLFIGALLLGERSYVSFVSLYLPRQPLLVTSVLAVIAALVVKRRMLAAGHAALCLVVLFPVMGMRVSSPPPARADRTIRLATYNVFFGKAGRPQLLDELVAMPVDILVLQATYDSLGDRIRERFPDRNMNQEGELVIITRFKILDVEVPEKLPGELKPMFVGYLLETPSGPLRVFCTHPFSPRNALQDQDEAWTSNVANREAQVMAVVAASRRPGPPFVIAGDTNLPYLSAIARREFAGLTDAFGEAGRGLGYTFPAKRPWMRIDRVLGGPGITFTSARVGPRGASDHLPVFVELELVTPAGGASGAP